MASSTKLHAYLFAVFGVEKNPANFYDLCGILGDIDPMLVARRSNMDNNVSVQVPLLALSSSRHIGRRI